MNDYGKLILKVGLGIVFIYFGVNQIMNPEMWVDLLPSFLNNLNFFQPESLIFLNGTFDILVGFCLILGLFLKIISVLAFLHLISIFIFSLGFTQSGIRDFGLALASLSLFFSEDDKFSLSRFLRQRQ
jgi:uncharacterized membrane protein YphA (DoxX/SURF4 family)